MLDETHGHLARRVRPQSPFREGRTADSANLGRDHHPFSFTLFACGGGIKPGITYGSSDELGFDVGENPVHRTICRRRSCTCSAWITCG